ncbi:MAG TPA: hypothetical protein VF530_08030 [Planctomycetota bacterium]
MLPSRPLSPRHGSLLLLPLVLLLAALPACRSRPVDEEALSLVLPRAPELVLPPAWRTLPLAGFEDWLLAALPEAVATPLHKTSLRELARALEEVSTPAPGGGQDPLAVRAALILGRSLHPASAAVLIRRLERRALGPERWSDAGDCVAAAALARFPNPQRYAQRLVPLAVGTRPHPDLEVRVECAATALHAGYTGVVPFLLQVLRIDTHAGRSDRRDFAVSPTTAWARGRAAEALSAHAGVPVTYRFDGSIGHREEEAARLEALLLPRGPSTSR